MKDRLAVICTRNPTEVLLKTIEGIKLFYSEFDIVIVDSDSTDTSMFSRVPADCIIEYVKNRGYELGAWTYAYNKYTNYSVYMFIQDALIPFTRIPNLSQQTFDNGTLYSFHYTARLSDGGHFDELQRVYRETDLHFISQLSPDRFIVGTAHASFITNRDSVPNILQLENAYKMKGIVKTKVHAWLSERTGGLLTDFIGNRRIDITPYFYKIHGGRT